MTTYDFSAPQSISLEDVEALLRDPFAWRRSGAVLPQTRLEDHAEHNAAGDSVEPSDSGDEIFKLFSDVATRSTVRSYEFPERPTRKPELKEEYVRVARMMAADRATAADRVNKLLEMDPRHWRDAISSDSDLRTMGVIEGIIASVNKTAHLTTRCFELTTLATEIISDLSGNLPALTIAQTRCEVWREHAWALLNLGRYPAALDAARHAATEIEAYPWLGLDTGLTEFVVATILTRQGKGDEASVHARRAADIFREMAETRRYVKARMLQGYGLYGAKRVAESLALWQGLIDEARASGELSTLAYLYNNIGNALRDLQKYGRASSYFRQAMGIFEDLGKSFAHEVPRVQLSVARLLYQQGKFEHALAENYRARGAFAALQMGSGVAAAELEIVEVLLVMKRVDEAEEMCRALPGVFRTYGMAGPELEAAAFLQECAVLKRLNVAKVVHVREYLRDLPQNPRLRFLRPVGEAGE